MFGGTRFQIIAVGGWLTAAILHSCAVYAQTDVPKGLEKSLPPVNESQGAPVKPPTPQNDTAADSKDDNPGPKSAAPEAAPVEKIRKPDPTCGPRCQESEQREKDDLEAQESMAQSTEEMADLTFWQVIFGACGLAALIYTLKLTRESNKAAIRAAEAAESQVAVSRDATEKELRAYVSIAEFNATYDIKDPQTGEVAAIAFRAKFQNTGATPAIQCKVFIDAAIVPADNFEMPSFTKKESDVLRELALGSNISAYSTRVNVARWKAEEIAMKQSRMFFYVRLDYRDIFDSTPARHTEVCVEVSLLANPKFVPPGVTPPASYAGIGPQNSHS